MESLNNKITSETKQENKNQSQNSVVNNQNKTNIAQQQISYKKPNERIKTKVIK
jgi:hypothetical protein